MVNIMTKMNLLLDVDGVLLNWLEGFEGYLLHEAHHLHRDFTGLEHVDTLEELLGMTEHNMHTWIERFHHDAHFEHLKPLPGAQKALTILKDWCHLVCITASGSSPDSANMRTRNLVKVFGDVFQDIICVDRSWDKPPHLAAYEAGYWVEDQLKNALMGVQAGHMSFLMDAPYNRKHDDHSIQRVTNMLQVGEIILSQSRSRCQEKAQS
jgi:uncharacterized HAD superfamily protein